MNIILYEMDSSKSQPKWLLLKLDSILFSIAQLALNLRSEVTLADHSPNQLLFKSKVLCYSVWTKRHIYCNKRGTSDMPESTHTPYVQPQGPSKCSKISQHKSYWTVPTSRFSHFLRVYVPQVSRALDLNNNLY